MNNLNFLVDVLKESPVFKTLEKNVKPGRTFCARSGALSCRS
jgi:transcription-repair coupling factor (superfamily II helicase)